VSFVSPIELSPTLPPLSEPIPLSELRALDPARIEELTAKLARYGFATVEVERAERVRGLAEGMAVARELDGFRFPPINVTEISYSPSERRAFKALYEVAIDCLSALNREAGGEAESDSLRREARADLLFASSSDEPFPADHPFHPTFFNLFNYNHGALNEHLDRGTLTVIHVLPPQPELRASELWVEGADGRWRSVDEVALRASAGGACVATLLLGEEGEERLAAEMEAPLFAAKHCVRVDPEGAYIERSHHCPDPSTTSSGNRLSAALILRRAVGDSTAD